MAKRNPINEKITSKTTAWDDGTNAYTGARVEEYIKESFEGKVGCFYYDSTNNRYLTFADDEARDAYLADPTSNTGLILGTFDAPFNYSASINLLSPSSTALLLGEEGNYIRFTFAVENKNGQAVVDDVVCTYTIRRGTNKTVVTERYRHGQEVNFCVDKYLLEGTNTVSIGIVGQSTLAATTVGVTYQVVNLTITCENTEELLTTHYSSNSEVEFRYKVEGSGTKTMEWYLDGVKQTAASNDESNETSVSKLRTIKLSSAAHGIHTIQARAKVNINGEEFYSNLLYREVMVYLGTSTAPLVTLGLDFGSTEAIKPYGSTLTIGGVEQYTTLPLSIGLYNPTGAATTNMTIALDSTTVATIAAENNAVIAYDLLLTNSGQQTLTISAGATTRTATLDVDPTSTSLQEITDGLQLNLRSLGKSNAAVDKNVWTSLGHTTTFSGFGWNANSGWTSDGLYIANGNSITVDIAPLNFTRSSAGRTIEIEFSTTAVDSDDAVICDLRTNGVGLVLTASDIQLASSSGNTIDCRFKKEETIRVAVVINRTSGDDKNLALIYVNGIASRAINLSNNESFASTKQLTIAGSANASVLLKQIMVYSTALSPSQVLNNYMLYRDTTSEMLSIYNRNNIEEDGSSSFDPDKLAAQVPVMIFTGDIPTLENTSDKNKQIIVDVEYINLQDPELSFTMTEAALRPQGTSSMGYPKKNFRLYTGKNSSTKVYDYTGKEITSKLYSFTKKAQPVGTWCLKADYAESSGTHNTGIARLWNSALYNATVNGQYVFRTQAQQIAADTNYPYDVRTTVDGFPVLLFYKLTESSNPVFIGKYNFNNDKSTESVFGFCDIPGFDNSRMQCWEVLNNGDSIALFQDVSSFDADWKGAFEARYPDGSTDHLSDLKTFCTWVNACKNNPTKFNSEMAQHLDLYKVAAYYVYLIRFGAVDQVVKNAMLTSEDGEHYYFINYDNDTIIGLSNDGPLAYGPTITRQSLDEKYENETYAYAGHESVLWNLLEGNATFMQMVTEADRALYTAGLSYASVIDMFDNKQAGMWCEKVYNQDARYKYIGPWLDSSTNNLHMLQGSRQSHRRWWLSTRFGLYDALFVSGEYKSQVASFKLANAPAGLQFSITAGVSQNYGWGVNDVVKESGVALTKGQSHTFTTADVLNLGDPVRIYAAHNITAIDLHNLIQYMAVVDLSNISNEVSGTMLKSLTLGVDVDNSGYRNSAVTSISGLEVATALTSLDIRGYQGLTSLDLTSQRYLTTLLAKGSNLTELSLASGAPVTTLSLPTTMQVLHLQNLPSITLGGVTLPSVANLREIKVKNCPNLGDTKSFVANWYSTKTTASADCTLELDNLNWTGVTIATLLEYGNIGNLTLKGRIQLTTTPTAEQMAQLRAIYGDTCFNKNAEFCILFPDGLYIISDSSVLEGDARTISPTVTTVVSSQNVGTLTLEVSGSTPTDVTVEIHGNPGDADYDEMQAMYGGPVAWVYATETGSARSVTLKLTHVNTNNETTSTGKIISITARTYPGSSSTIEGATTINPGAVTQYDFNPVASSGTVNGNYYLQWSIVAPTGSGVVDISSSVTIVEQIDSYVKIQLADGVDEGDFRICCVVKRTATNATNATIYKNVSYLDTETLMTTRTNPEVLAVCYAAGWCASSTRMTKTEAAAVTDIGTTFERNARITHFEELEAFTRLVSIPSNAFYRCIDLTSVTIPNSVTSIGNSAFENCSGLTSVTIGDSVTYIGRSAFASCSGLTSVTIPNSVTIIDKNAFENCSGLTSVTIGDSVTSIGNSAFASCSGLTSVTIPNSVTSIGYYAFQYCRGLKTVTIGSSVTSIGNSAFENCSGLTSVTIPDSVTSIGNSAFENCSGLTSVTIPNSVTIIGYYAFRHCLGLTAFYGKYASSDNRCLIIDGTLNSFAPNGLTTYSIPNSVTSIGSSAFENCSGLTSVSIPNSVTSIGGAAFKDCSGLTSVTIPNSVTKIGSSAFKNCTSLTSVTIPNSVTSIGDSAFNGCTSLTSVTIPNSVTSIGYYAFAYCTALATIIAKPTTAPTVSSNPFGSTTSNYTGLNTYDQGTNKLYVPTGATGYDASYWLSPLCDASKCGFTLVETDDIDNI